MKRKLFSLGVFFQIFGAGIYAQTDTVIMYEMTFRPAVLTINAGAKVIWINKTKQDHTCTSGTNCAKDGKWNSGYIGEGKSFSYTFDSAGAFNYFCIPHCLSGMKGKIIVTENKNPPVKSDELKKKDEKRTEESTEVRKPSPNFKGSDIINAVTVKTLDKGILDFAIYHRFDDLTGVNGGFQKFYGLDNIRDFRIALTYGLVKNISIGVGRSKGDWFNSPYQEVKNLYDASVKIRLCSQEENNKKFPFSIAVNVNTVYCAMKSEDIPGSEANFQHFTDRFSHSAQLIVEHSFAKYLSLQLMSVYLRRNWVNTYPGVSGDELDLFSLGGGLRWGFSDRFAILAEYFYVFSGYRKDNANVFSNPLAVGVEFNTGGHIFHINLSNATGIIPNTFLPYTTTSWLKNGFKLGFSISRKFIINKKSNKAE